MRDQEADSAPLPRLSASARGFTLVEMIVAMVLIGALAAVSAMLVVQPFQANEALQRRAALVEATDQALDRIIRDARRALPNSLRSQHAGHVEFIPVRTGARYRRLPGNGGNDTFVPARQADSFEVLGRLMLDGDEITDLNAATSGVGVDCGAGIPCMSVYNTGQPGFDAYFDENVAQLTTVAEDSIAYDNGAANGRGFAGHSPRQRFFIFDNVVTYECSDGDLRRSSGYGLGNTPDSNDWRLVARGVTRCEFDYSEGSATRRGLLTIELGLTRGGETVNLLDQAQVPNAP